MLLHGPLSSGLPTHVDSPASDVAISMSASESCLSCQCISPMDPTLEGREEISARDTSISNEVLLDCIKTVEPRTAWDEKEMSSTIYCLIIDLTQWLIVPCAGFRGPSSAKHWSVVKTFKACSSPSDRSILTRVGARHKLTVSMISWSRVNHIKAMMAMTHSLFSNIKTTQTWQ